MPESGGMSTNGIVSSVACDFTNITPCSLTLLPPVVRTSRHPNEWLLERQGFNALVGTLRPYPCGAVQDVATGSSTT